MSTIIQSVVTSLTGTASEIDATSSTGAVTIGIVDPLAVSKGGTGDAGSALTVYSPTITTGAGTITTLGSVTGRYKQIGKIVTVQMSIAITTNGTGAQYVRATLPVSANASFTYPMHGQENLLNGKGLSGRIDPAISSGSVIITFYDASYPGASGCRLVMTGIYEAS